MNMRAALRKCVLRQESLFATTLAANSMDSKTMANQTLQEWKRYYMLPATSLAFAGHFPERPVLPAVVQVLMAQMTVEEVVGKPLRLLNIAQAKFSAVLGPDMEIRVQVAQARKSGYWACSLHRGEILAASLQLQLQEVEI